jgi:hypothetical protein
MTTTEQVEQIITATLYRNPSVVQRLKIREVAGEITSCIASQVEKDFAKTQIPRRSNKAQTRAALPHLRSAVDMCCMALGIEYTTLYHRSSTPMASAVAWMLRRGIAFPVPPSLPEIADAMGYLSHTSALNAIRDGSKNVEHVARIYYYMAKHGIATNPRPEWAKEAA